jgi:hypothetical protein
MILVSQMMGEGSVFGVFGEKVEMMCCEGVEVVEDQGKTEMLR